MFSPAAAQRLLGALDAPPARRAAFPDRTDREHEILRMVAAGTGNVEIGRRLGLRPKTVRNYVSNVIAKIHAEDRADAVLRARDAGLTARRSGRGWPDHHEHRACRIGDDRHPTERRVHRIVDHRPALRGDGGHGGVRVGDREVGHPV